MPKPKELVDSKSHLKELGLEPGERVPGFEDEGPTVILPDEDEVSAQAGPGWSWANPCTAYYNGTWLQRHPTRHVSCGGWRSATEVSATAIMNRYWGYVSCNTYYNHPEDYWYDTRSIDIWAWNSRGLALPTSQGNTVFNWLWQAWPTQMQYVIWNGYYYGYANNYVGTYWGDHYDHIHLTFF